MNGGLTGEYYNFTSASDPYFFQKKVLSRTDQEVNFVFRNNAPATGVNRDLYAVRWHGYIIPPKTGKFILCTCSDDGVRLYFNGENRIDRWNTQSSRFWGTEVSMEVGKKYPIRLEYHDNNSFAMSQLWWAENSAGATWEQVCKNVTPPTDPANPATAPAPERCSPDDDVINPALEIVSGAYLQPGTNEADPIAAACEVPPPVLNTESAPDPLHPNTQRARKLFQRLGGIDVAIFDTRLALVKSLLDQRKPKEAARYVTSFPTFYDRTVRSFAARISTRAERPDVPLNDLIATVVGVTRDRIDARKLLTGSFLYRANPKLLWNDQSHYDGAQLLASNRHYETIDAMRVPLACALDKLDNFNLIQVADHMQQKVLDPTGNEQTNPDPAGVLTSRAFAEAHIIAGTNRRPVQKAFEYFACAPIDSWRDAEISDQYVGRDVERFPNGPASYNEFLNNCKTCHGPMDSMRGAFSQFHFENNQLKYGPHYLAARRFENPAAAAEQQGRMKLTAGCQESNPLCNPASDPRLSVHWKLNHNVNYRDGYFVKDDSFNNLLTSSRHMLRFGWSGSTSGRGVREFGRMLANSKAFPVCMASRVYSEVCKDDPFRSDFPPELTQWIEKAGEGFAANGYDLKDLFETVSVNCLD